LVFHLDPPFKTGGPGGIRPGGLPRWLKLLTKLAAILDLGVQSRLARTLTWPGGTSFSAAKTANLPKIHLASTWHPPGGFDIGGPFATRWAQVDPGGVHLAKKSYRTYPNTSYKNPEPVAFRLTSLVANGSLGPRLSPSQRRFFLKLVLSTKTCRVRRSFQPFRLMAPASFMRLRI